ncbi:sigma factor-like helix-turn-helix DNA-binding protein [Euzebya tangerina]|uniref:sigma factor-like helix-turn-helix DNA-binding protein n=1 Tax=Euzebya tangerina TaxID=591198 RepID=UPI000E30F439|nr:sigma factor-like helix-turn-helix DNA-binding protein [Euzebya tangerina]
MSSKPETGRDSRGQQSPRPKQGGEGRSNRRSGKGGRRDSRSTEEQEAVRLRSKLLSLLKRLPEVERRVLEARMGLVDGQPMKPGEVAKMMGMTIPEVKKIEARAFERIRQIGPLKGLERFLGN